MIITIIYVVVSILLIILLTVEYVKDLFGLTMFDNDKNNIAALIIFVSIFWPVSLFYWIITRVDKLLKTLRRKNIKDHATAKETEKILTASKPIILED